MRRSWPSARARTTSCERSSRALCCARTDGAHPYQRNTLPARGTREPPPTLRARELMRQYVLQRLLQTAPVLVGVTLLAAGLIRLVPGDAVLVKLEESGHVSDLEAARRALGLDRSFPEQYLSWVANVLRGDFGTSFISDQPVLP